MTVLANISKLAQYSTIQQYEPGRATEVKDPAGSGRTVFQLEVKQGDYPGVDPRCQPLTGEILVRGGTYYCGHRVWIPSAANGGPAKTSGSQFLLHFEIFGEPFEGSPPFSLKMFENKLQFQRNSTYEFDTPYLGAFSLDTWHTVLIGTKVDTKANGGYVEVWIDGKQLTFDFATFNPKGEAPTTKLLTNILDPGSNDKAGKENMYIVDHYRNKGSFADQHLFIDGTYVATTKAEVEELLVRGGPAVSEATKQFGFNGATTAQRRDEERWVPTAGGATGIGLYDSATGEDSPNDPGLEPHMLAIEREGKELINGAPFWEWTGTYLQLGVPAGATITDINMNVDAKCDVFETSIASSVGPFELRDEAAALLGTFREAEAYAGAFAWATKPGTKITGLNHAVTKKIKLRLNAVPKTGNSAAADNRLLLDWAVVTITYTPAESTTPVDITARLGTGTLNQGAIRRG